MGKKSKPPPAPDYTALAVQTAASQAEAAKVKTVADRPNQVDIYGNTSNWVESPTGEWTQTQSLGAEGQNILAQQKFMRDLVTGQAKDALGKTISFEGLPELTGYDLSQLQDVDLDQLKNAGLFNLDPFGNSKEIQDATYKLLTPQRQLERASEIQRLKNQGLTEDSPAFQRAIQRLDQGDTEAQIKSLIAGQTEYGNQFERAMGQNQQNWGQNLDSRKISMALRDQQFDEQSGVVAANAAMRNQGLMEQDYLRQQPLNELDKILRMQSYNVPQFGQFAVSTGSPGVNYLGAGQQQHDAAVSATNASNAGKASQTSGLISLASTAAAIF